MADRDAVPALIICMTAMNSFLMLSMLSAAATAGALVLATARGCEAHVRRTLLPLSGSYFFRIVLFRSISFAVSKPLADFMTQRSRCFV